MKELFRTMFLLDTFTKPEDKTEIALYIILYTFWIPLVLVVTFVVFPLYALLTPLRLLYRKMEEDAINEYVGHW